MSLRRTLEEKRTPEEKKALDEKRAERLFRGAYYHEEKSRNKFNNLSEEKRAVKLYIKAIKCAEHPRAKNNLGAILYHRAAINFSQGSNEVAENQLQFAIGLFEQAAAQGSLDAVFNMAIVHRDRYGSLREMALSKADYFAFDWLNRGIKQGYLPAIDESYDFIRSYLQRAIENYLVAKCASSFPHEPQWARVKRALDYLTNFFQLTDSVLSHLSLHRALEQFEKFLFLLGDAYCLYADVLESRGIQDLHPAEPERTQQLHAVLSLLNRLDRIPLPHYANFIWGGVLMKMGQPEAALEKLKQATPLLGFADQLVDNAKQACSREIAILKGKKFKALSIKTKWFAEEANSLKSLKNPLNAVTDTEMKSADIAVPSMIRLK